MLKLNVVNEKSSLFIVVQIFYHISVFQMKVLLLYFTEVLENIFVTKCILITMQ